MKILASDFDGTLYRNGTVSSEEKNAISKWRALGNFFGIVTGRNYASLMEDLCKFDLEYDFIISTNGSLIRDGKGNVLKSFESDGSISREIVALIEKNDASWAEMMYLDSCHRRLIKRRKPGSELNVNWEILDESKTFHQISFALYGIEKAKKLNAEINEKYFGRLSAYCIVNDDHETSNIDVVKFGVSKAHALEEYAALKGVQRENIITVGDNYNDIPMIRAFDGYIIESAADEVKLLVPKTCKNLCQLML